MDNVTHVLVSLAIGEAAVQLYEAKHKSRPPKLRSALWLSSLFAGTCPDLDFLVAPLTGGKLGYLLHHRGHTHTLLMAIPQALLSVALLWRVFRPDRAALGWMVCLAVFSGMLHVGLDTFNIYGTHPFWPFANHWIYGDMVFIVEPWIWLTLLPALMAAVGNRLLKGIWALLFATGVGLLFLSGYIPLPFALVVSLCASMIALLTWKLRERGRIFLALGSATAVAALFFTLSALTRDKLSAHFQESFPTRLLDLSLSPFPSNPICWSFISVETDGDNYLARRGVFSVAPSLLDASDCPAHLVSDSTTAPLDPVPVADSPRLVWRGEFRGKTHELRDLYRDNCEAEAFLRFSRIPFWTLNPDGSGVLGDLRFDRQPELGFAEIAFSARRETCPRHVPPWTAPRKELLE